MRLLSLRALEGYLETDRAQLRKLAYEASKYYSPYDQRKTQHDKWRHIDNPIEELKRVQKRIYKEILCRVQLPSGIQGAIKGRSIKSNAAMHIGQQQVASLDLKNCFYNTGFRKVFRIFREVFGCSTEIADLLTKLTTFEYRLPVGAPTSPLLSAFIILPTFSLIQQQLKRHSVNVSIWVDDIVISGEQVFSLLPLVKTYLERAGYEVHPGKQRKMGASGCQLVPGAIVNRKISAGRQRIRSIRNEIFNIGKLTSKGISHTTLQRIRGRISQIRFLSESQGEALSRCAERYLPDGGDLPSYKTPLYYRRCLDWKRDHSSDSEL